MTVHSFSTQYKVHAVQFYANAAWPNHRRVTVSSSRLCVISWTRVHWHSSMADYNYFTKTKMTQSSGWNL